MKRKIWTALLLCVIPAVMWSNDGVVYVNGNQLVPINETEISIAKEVLTISIRDDGYADVDVLYELTNHGKEKTVSMGFEAEAPYNVEAPFNKEGQTMVGRSMIPCHNERSQAKIHEMLSQGTTNCYTISKRGQKKMIFQTPWVEDGKVQGLVEFSFVIPEDMPHYDRG